MLSKETISCLEDTMSASVESNEVAGANLLVFRKGKEMVYHEEGFSSLEDKKAISRDSIFRLYSMSKPVTAAAVMLLVERGLIDLFDGVRQYIPGFGNQMADVNGRLEPVNREISIQDLMNMTSGLLYGGESMAGKETEKLFDEMDRRLLGDSPMTTAEMADNMGRIPLAFHPGESWDYGTSADILGALVESVSGISFGTFLKEEFFEPLGMKDTDFYVPEEKQNRLTKTYQSDPQSRRLELYQGNYLAIINKMDRKPAFESGGAGLVSTIDDYMKFAQMLLGKGSLGKIKILNPATVQFMTSGRLMEENQRFFQKWHTLEGHSYGNLLRKAVEPEKAGLITSKGEYGWDGWLGCHFANFPAEEISLLVMLQKKDAGTTPLTRKIRNIVLSELLS